ncbi:MAG: 50S ribosomal protein L15 [Victivallales bacterium]|jgi:large subunit ribosomal protein L15|nr:50S ribosomal protein L15 [Victivallales bacterium]MBR6076538.1 50S ribosomal protein L15 [Victivallales bacterium]
MKLHDLHNTVPRQARKRVGRGDGSGHGRTAGRGDKGAGARTGHTNRPYFEGGQIPLIRRLPKRGFKNPNHIEYEVINLAELEELFEAGAVVDAKVLQERGVMKKGDRPLKILADGDLTKALKVTADKFSAAAKQKIEAVGGSCTVIEHPVYNEMERRAARKAAAAAEAKKG